MLWWNLRQLKSGNQQTRRRAVKGLGRSRDPRAIDPLMAALNDGSYLVRQEAARALGEIGDARAVRSLVNLIGESFQHALVTTAVGALEKVLGRAAAAAVSEDVRAAATLSDVSGLDHEYREGIAWFFEDRNVRAWTMDCSRIRKLAHQELIRRGLAA